MPEDKLHVLISNIERKDRRFRLAQVIFMFLIFVGGGTFAVYTYVHNQHQSASRAATILAIERHNDQQIQTTNQYIQCIAQFFARTDRANLSLSDLDKCTILKNGESVPGVNLSPSSGPLNTDQQKTSSTGANTNNAQGSAPADTNQNDNSPAAPTPAVSAPSNPQPVHILGIPVCVPLTNVCVMK